MSPYIPLPKGCVRLLRLLPPSGDNSRIECQLITCSLLDSTRTHSYEALSYFWGLEKSKEPIWIDGHQFSVGANLYSALSHLRDRFVERILWVDAICINQEDKTGEKEQQVQSMAKIYSRASQVIVWLGQATSDSDQALEAMRAAAEEEQGTNPSLNETCKQAIITLLEREWFQRIWVLQEVAAARHVLIRCGFTEIDGYAFCLGLSALRPFDMRPDLQALIPPVAYLIRGAIFRRRHRGNEVSQSDRFSLKIRPLSELVDMYHTRKASIPLDKVYALIGMSSDDPDAAGLQANYKISWKDLFRKLICFSLSNQMTVSTWDDEEVAVIEAKGYVLGEVSSTGKDAIRRDKQYINITWKDATSSRFTLEASAKAVKEGDIICLLQGASRPTIVRLCGSFSSIIITTVPLTDNLRKLSASVMTFPTDFLLIWDWDEPRRMLQGGGAYEKIISGRKVPRCSVAECQCLYGLEKATRLWNFGLLLNRIERYEEAVKNFREAVELYGIRERFRSVDKTYQGHSPWREVDEEVLRIMDDLLIDDKSANIQARYKEHNQTPLSWAAEMGYEAVVQLLINKGARIEAKDNDSRTPLSWAAEKGHEAVMRLLIDNGASAATKDNRGRTPLLWAATNGHEAAVRLLIGKGASVKVKDNNCYTPLLWAVVNRHETVIRLLIDKGASAKTKDNRGRTPLLWAAMNGLEAVIQLLIDKGAGIETKDNKGQTPLSSAAENGHEAVIQLLIDKGAGMETKDNRGRTPLLWAAEMGHEAVLRLLIKKGANIEPKDNRGRTPLWWAAAKGYKLIVRLLIDNGASIEAKDSKGRTPISQAAENGYEEVIQLLIQNRASFEIKDTYGQTPLSRAAEKGHYAVVQLLIEKGANVETEDHKSWTPLLWAIKKGRKEVVRLLIEKGASHEAAVHFFITKGSHVQAKDNDGTLYQAVAKHRLELDKGRKFSCESCRLQQRSISCNTTRTARPHRPCCYVTPCHGDI
ncbi:ankyrin repeat-containing domain protein [Cladorrhinum sp. PSN259]|nr:ankyrin repeat-containing domain protein [Cladorrhinum sp. PSN259]